MELVIYVDSHLEIAVIVIAGESLEAHIVHFN